MEEKISRRSLDVGGSSIEIPTDGAVVFFARSRPGAVEDVCFGTSTTGEGILEAR